MKTRSVSFTDVEVGKRIRTERLAKSMSQGELGNRVGVTFQQMQKYENGKNRVTPGRLQAIADVLDVSISRFFPSQDGKKADRESAYDHLQSARAVRMLQAFNALKSVTQLALLELVESLAADPSAVRTTKKRATA